MYLVDEVLPTGATAGVSATEVALDEFDRIHAFIYSRVGNRADAEDLTQQVALKAVPRLRNGASAPEVRGYLYATARSVMATFWSSRFQLPQTELTENLHLDVNEPELPSPPTAEAWVARILDGLSPSHRELLELRFLRGYSLQEVAQEMGKSLGSVKVMQLRALRRAAVIGESMLAPASHSGALDQAATSGKDTDSSATSPTVLSHDGGAAAALAGGAAPGLQVSKKLGGH